MMWLTDVLYTEGRLIVNNVKGTGTQLDPVGEPYNGIAGVKVAFIFS